MVRLIKALHQTPKNLFIIDGFGAILSAFLLGIVLVKWEPFFGIPVSTLYVLASFPVFFAIYDFYCYLTVVNKWGTYLKRIALWNLLYCGLSIGFALYHYKKITYFGWTYIVLEIIVVTMLAMIELSVAKNEFHKSQNSIS